jgi:GPH family glycoside/pentoside/hexuronide:cation symporter
MFYQLYFLTDIAGVRPDYAAWAIAAGRVWDAINDPLFGIISDRIRSRFGRRRVLLLFGAVPLGVAFAMMWIVPEMGQTGLAIYYALTFIFFDTCFTAVHVAYNSLTPEITEDYDERSSLNGYRMVFSIAGTLGAIILATLLSPSFEDPRQLFFILGVGLGGFSILPPLIVFGVTKEYKTNLEGEPLPAAKSIMTTIRNKPFQKVMGLYLFSWTTASIMAAILVYFANYYLQVPDQANYFVLAAQGAAIVFVPLVVSLSKKWEKRRAFIVGMGVWIVLLLVLSATQSNQVGLVYALAAFSGFGIATVYVVPWAMIPDIIEHDELETGLRREGSFYAFASFFQKLGTGAALWAMGQVLARSGYITPEPGSALPTQPESAVLAIRLFMGIIPVILLLASILFAWRYPITREKHRELLERLAEGD